MAYRVFDDERLLAPPVKRAAYSDRMALLMAEMSLLAYTDFEAPEDPLGGELGAVLASVRSAPSDTDALDILRGLVSDEHGVYRGTSARTLSDLLERGGFTLVATYDSAPSGGGTGGDGTDTQAFLAKNDPDAEAGRAEKIAVLAFRGTEGKIEDIKTDANMLPKEVNGLTFHSGFWDGFAAVEDAIERDLAPLRDDGYALYLTGHSLGGALALVATYKIAGDSTGACYTFGQPRMAGYGLARSIRTPIYRVVNGNDIVPRMPPTHLLHALAFIVSLVPILGQKYVNRLLEKFTRYVHHGDMRYLKRRRGEGSGNYGPIVLLANSNMLHQLWWFVTSWPLARKSPLEDHYKDAYCEKLREYAKDRLS
jgi:hypothetical protein